MAKGKVKLIVLACVLSLFFLFLTAHRPVVGQEDQGAGFEATVNQKLEQILKTQENILAQIEATKEEIIRLRKWSR
jgi:hypothetical protein